MDDSLFRWVISGVSATGMLMVGYLFNRVEGNEQGLSELRLHIAQNFVQKEDLYKILDDLRSQLTEIKMENKESYNQINSKIDKILDKISEGKHGH